MRTMSDLFALLMIVMTLSLIITCQFCIYFASNESTEENRNQNLQSSHKILSNFVQKDEDLLGHHNQRRLSEASETANLQYRLRDLESRLFNMSDLKPVHQDKNLKAVLRYRNQKMYEYQEQQNKDHALSDQTNQKMSPYFDKRKEIECSKDLRDKPYLRYIKTDPSLALTPSFASINNVYEAVVEYSAYVINVHVMPVSCFCETRLEDGDLTVRSFNYTLGLGVNTLKIAVVDVSQNEPIKVNSYTFHIHRSSQGTKEYMYSHALPLKTCVLKQDCRMVFSESESCDLQVDNEFHTWDLYLKYMNNLPHCSASDIPDAQDNFKILLGKYGKKLQPSFIKYSGHVFLRELPLFVSQLEGVWYVPCTNCAEGNSCYWKKAVWQPRFCKIKTTSDNDIKNCFTSKRLLFIGDSTNRGILNYIIERINGTLMNWDKTHNFRRYLNINHNKTVLSFAYYPQFWLPYNHRPSFDKAIYQLIKWTLPLENTTNTVLVVGGVQWLDKSHINLIIKAIQREGLTGIKLILKGIGAGFHQNVDGLMYVPMDEQRSYVSREEELGAYGRKYGFKVVPTFNMTMARYRDFYPGQCACHFHKVSAQTADQMTRGFNEYHVEGDVNSVYSELIINEICKPRTPD